MFNGERNRDQHGSNAQAHACEDRMHTSSEHPAISADAESGFARAIFQPARERITHTLAVRAIGCMMRSHSLKQALGGATPTPRLLAHEGTLSMAIPS
jgi:hypothetical protein